MEGYPSGSLQDGAVPPSAKVEPPAGESGALHHSDSDSQAEGSWRSDAVRERANEEAVSLSRKSPESAAQNGSPASSPGNEQEMAGEPYLEEGRVSSSVEGKNEKSPESSAVSDDGADEAARERDSPVHPDARDGDGSKSLNRGQVDGPGNQTAASSANDGLEKQASPPGAAGAGSTQQMSDREAAYARWLQRKQEEAHRRKLRRQEEAEKLATEREAIMEARRERARRLRRRLDEEKETRKKMEQKLLQKMLRSRRTKRKAPGKSKGRSRPRRAASGSRERAAQSQRVPRKESDAQRGPHSRELRRGRARDGSRAARHLSTSVPALPPKLEGRAQAWSKDGDAVGVELMKTPPRAARQERHPPRSIGDQDQQHSSLPELPARKRPNFVQRIQDSPLNKTLRSHGSSSRSPERARSMKRRTPQRLPVAETSPLNDDATSSLQFDGKEDGEEKDEQMQHEEVGERYCSPERGADVTATAGVRVGDESGAEQDSGRLRRASPRRSPGKTSTNVQKQQLHSPSAGGRPKPRTPVLQRRNRSQHASRPGLQRLGPAETTGSHGGKGGTGAAMQGASMGDTISPMNPKHRLFDPTVPVSRQFNRFSPSWGFVDASHPPLPHHHRQKVPRRVSPIRASNESKPARLPSARMGEWSVDVATSAAATDHRGAVNSGSHESVVDEDDREAPGQRRGSRGEEEVEDGRSDERRPAPSTSREEVPGPPRLPPPPPPRSHRRSLGAPETGLPAKAHPTAGGDDDGAARRLLSGRDVAATVDVEESRANHHEKSPSPAIPIGSEDIAAPGNAAGNKTAAGENQDEPANGEKTEGGNVEDDRQAGEEEEEEEGGGRSQEESEGEQQENSKAETDEGPSGVAPSEMDGDGASAVQREPRRDSGAPTVASTAASETVVEEAASERVVEEGSAATSAEGDDEGAEKEDSARALEAEEEQVRREVHGKLLSAYLLRQSRDASQSKRPSQEQHDKANAQAQQLLDAHGITVWDQIERRRPGTTGQFKQFAEQEIQRRLESLRRDHAAASANRSRDLNARNETAATAAAGEKPDERPRDSESPVGNGEVTFHKSESPGRRTPLSGNGSPGPGAGVARAASHSPSGPSPYVSDPLEESDRMRVLLFFHRVAPDDASLGMNLYHQYRDRVWTALRQKYPQEVTAFEEEFPEDTNPMILRSELRHMGVSLAEPARASGGKERGAAQGADRGNKGGAADPLVAARRALTGIPSAQWKEIGADRGSDWVSIAVLGLVCVLLGEDPKMTRAMELMGEAATPARLLRVQPSALSEETLALAKKLVAKSRLLERAAHIQNNAMRILVAWELAVLQVAGVRFPSLRR